MEKTPLDPEWWNKKKTTIELLNAVGNPWEGVPVRVGNMTDKTPRSGIVKFNVILKVGMLIWINNIALSVSEEMLRSTNLRFQNCMNTGKPSHIIDNLPTAWQISLYNCDGTIHAHRHHFKLSKKGLDRVKRRYERQFNDIMSSPTGPSYNIFWA
jgi:hypothetical protein